MTILFAILIGSVIGAFAAVMKTRRAVYDGGSTLYNPNVGYESEFLASELPPAPMTRDEAIALLRHCALISGQFGEHSYLPYDKATAAVFHPHNWVVDAVMQAHAQALA